MSLAGITAYLRPQTLAEAFSLLGDGSIPVSGGTDAILHTSLAARTLVDLTDLPLSYIRHHGGFAIGATTTLSEMLEHHQLAEHMGGVMPSMLRQVGSPLLRNVATIGGHLARGRLSDVVPVLLVLEASVTVYDGSERTVSLADFYREELHRTRMLLTQISLPAAAPLSAAAFVKICRTSFDMAQINCAAAAVLQPDSRVAACRLAVGETPGLATLIPEAEAAVAGNYLDDPSISAAAEAAAAAIPAGSDQRASAEYRRALCLVAVRRCLERVRHLLVREAQ